jgi:hypothetical protein
MFRFTLAYLDPGTGSMILQALLGGIAGLAVYLKTKGRRVFRRKPADKVPERTDA